MFPSPVGPAPPMTGTAAPGTVLVQAVSAPTTASARQMAMARAPTRLRRTRRTGGRGTARSCHRPAIVLVTHVTFTCRAHPTPIPVPGNYPAASGPPQSVQPSSNPIPPTPAGSAATARWPGFRPTVDEGRPKGQATGAGDLGGQVDHDPTGPSGDAAQSRPRHNRRSSPGPAKSSTLGSVTTEPRSGSSGSSLDGPTSAGACWVRPFGFSPRQAVIIEASAARPQTDSHRGTSRAR